jgi:hypothetical protein
MNIIKVYNNRIVLEVSSDELGVFVNALNEVCNGIEVPEFDKKIGINIENAENILKFLASIYRKHLNLIKKDQ